MLNDKLQLQLEETLINYVSEDLPKEVVSQKELDGSVDRRGLEHLPDTSNYK